MLKRIARAIFNFFLDFLQTIVTALSIFVIVYLFLVQPHQVKGNSMHTTLEESFNDGEYILTNKIGYRFEEPQRGEVIVFKAPQNEEYDYIKRIIGVPGDSVKIEQGKVYVNNQLLDESHYLPSDVYTAGGYYLREGEETEVSPNQYFVLGDNRAHSSDSREWGFVQKENIVGKAWFRYWPLGKIGVVKYY